MIRLAKGNWTTLALTICFGISSWLTAPLGAQGSPLPDDHPRPPITELLPEETVAFVQVPSVKGLRENFAATGLGQMMADPQVAPLIDDVYAELIYLFSDVEETIGVGLDELLSIPSGELCFAVVAPRRQSPVMVLLVDVTEEHDGADRLIQAGREQAIDGGAFGGTEEEAGFEIEVFDVASDQQVYLVRHGQTILICNGREVLSEILLRWAGVPLENSRTLAQNRKFITIMNRCRSVHADRGHEFAFYIDPFELISSALRGEAQRLLVMGLLRTAGLDGLLAIGGTALFDEQDYESIFHLHVSLSNPRKGIFQAIALKPGMSQPEPWVPDDVTSYLTLNWDVNDAFQKIQEIYDSYEPATPWEELIDRNVNQQLDIDFKEDFVQALSGRVTVVTWMEPPARVNSQINAVAIGLNDPQSFRSDVLGALESQFDLATSDQVEMTEHRGIEIWQRRTSPEQQEWRERMREEQEFSMDIRVPSPALAIIGESLVFSDSDEFIRKAIETFRGDHPILADDDEYSQVTREMMRLLGTDLPAMTMYSDPAEQFRMWFDLAGDEGLQDALQSVEETFQFGGGLARALEDNPLPSFDDLADYLAPSGGFVTNDESGWHLLMFQITSERSRIGTSGTSR